MRSIWNVILPVEHLEAARRAGSGTFHCPRRVAELLHRLIEHEKISGENG